MRPRDMHDNDKPLGDGCPPSRWADGLDEREARSLDATWAAFTRLLDAVQSPVDESAVLAGVRRRHADVDRRRRRRRVVAGLALAASLLVAVSISWNVARQRWIAQVPNAPVVAVVPDNPGAPLPAASIGDWPDDGMDQAFAEVEIATGEVETRWAYRPSAVDELDARLTALEWDVSLGGM